MTVAQCRAIVVLVDVTYRWALLLVCVEGGGVGMWKSILRSCCRPWGREAMLRVERDVEQRCFSTPVAKHTMAVRRVYWNYMRCRALASHRMCDGWKGTGTLNIISPDNYLRRRDDGGMLIRGRRIAITIVVTSGVIVTVGVVFGVVRTVGCTWSCMLVDWSCGHGRDNTDVICRCSAAARL